MTTNRHRLPLLATPGMARPAQVPAPPAAAVTTDEVRQLIYDREESWGWVVEFEAATDGIAAIYEDGSGDIWRIPITVGTDDTITLGEAVPVRMVFVQTTDDGRSAPLAASLAAAGSRRTIARFAPADPAAVRATRTGTDARLTVSTPDTTDTPTTEEQTMDLTALREAYGLSADMSDEDVLAHVAAQAPTADPDADPDPTGDADPDPTGDADPEPTTAGATTVTVSAERWQEVQAQLATLTADNARRTTEENSAHRDQLIVTALSTGRITPGERQTWRDELDQAPEATERLLLSLAPGRRMPVTELGTTGGTADDADARYQALTASAPKYSKR